MANSSSIAMDNLGRELAKRHHALGNPYTFTSNALLERQARTESNARSYPRRIPLALRRAQGIYVEDIEGRVFIDCLAGAGTLALGHNHPLVTEAITQVIDEQVPLHTLDLTTPVKDRFVQELFETLPAELARDAKVQFCGPTGADAVEAALKLARTVTGRNLVLAFHGAYHGMTYGALNLMGNLGPKRALNGSLQNVQFLPFPCNYRCPFGIGGARGARAVLTYIRSVLNDSESGVPQPAAAILEIVQGEGGVRCAPDDWVAALRTVTAAADVPLIIDEVQTGFGRTGRMFAFEHSGVTPDVLVLSKAIGGSLPLSVVVYRGSLDTWEPGAHAGTFRGNQLAMAAGAATLRHIRSQRLDLHAEEIGQQLQRSLRQLQDLHPELGDVRGRGLMIGVEIVDPHGEPDALGNPPPAPALAKAVQAACLSHGLIVELGGRDGAVLRLLPPLIMTRREAAYVVDIIAAAVRAAVSQLCDPSNHSGSVASSLPMDHQALICK